MPIPLVTSWSSGGEISHHCVPSLIMEMLEQYQVADLVRGSFFQFHIASDRGGESMIGSMRVLTCEGRAVQFDGVLTQRAWCGEEYVLRAVIGVHLISLSRRMRFGGDRSLAGGKNVRSSRPRADDVVAAAVRTGWSGGRCASEQDTLTALVWTPQPCLLKLPALSQRWPA